MTIDHDAIAARVRQNREAGTPGPWRIHDCDTIGHRCTHYYQEIWNDETDIIVTTEVTRAHNDGGVANMRRIADLPDLEAAYLDLHDEVKRLRAERDAGKRTVPAGQTPLDDKLNQRFLDVIREGEAARDAGTASPYHGHSLEHCLHATGWVSRDLRLALDEARARAEKAEAERVAEWNRRREAEASRDLEKAVCATIKAERDRLRAALTIYAQSGNWRLGGCCDPNSPNFTGEAIARAALKGQTNE